MSPPVNSPYNKDWQKADPVKQQVRRHALPKESLDSYMQQYKMLYDLFSKTLDERVEYNKYFLSLLCSDPSSGSYRPIRSKGYFSNG